jgi:type I restriction enzyme, S subunit
MTRAHIHQWPKRRLGEFLVVLTDYHANGSYEKLRENVTLLDKPSYAVMIRTTNFEKGDFLDDLKFISESAYNYLSKSKVQPGDILMNKIANAGSVYQMPDIHRPVSLAMNLFLLRTNEHELNQQYAFYYLKANEGYIKSFANGTATKTITKEAVRNLTIAVPALSVQKEIVQILSPYEELIENNQRRIRILEEIARLLYREWFVNFRFPGHEKVPLVDSQLGPIPKGWQVRKVGEVAEIFRGRSYRSLDLAEEGGLPFLNLKCLDRDGGFRRSGLKRYSGEYGQNHVAKKGDIVIAVTDMTQERRVVARAASVPTLTEDFGVFSMDLVRVEPTPPMQKSFFYCFLRFSSFADEVKQHANGANVLHLSPDRIRDYRFAVPTSELMSSFASVVRQSMELMDTLENQNENLRCTRDLLLPRLISGSVELSAPCT